MFIPQKHHAFVLIVALMLCLLASTMLCALLTQVLMQRRVVHNLQEVATIEMYSYAKGGRPGDPVD